MKNQHTFGPWIIDRGQIRDTDGNSLASVPYSLGGTQDYANARLIAAAPDLLSALRLMLTSEMPPEGTMEWKIENGKRMQAQAAIAKAEGVA